MFRLMVSSFAWLGVYFRSRNNLGLEILALRQQVGVLKRQNPRPRLSRWDRLFWVLLRRLWSRWTEVLMVVKPESAVKWHRAGFRLYWRFVSRQAERGRPRTDEEIRKLIHGMAAENPTWGTPRIHGELLKLGLEISERTVSRYLARVDRHRDAGKRWRIFLHNHREAIAAMDFFTVPTATFRVLYCFFVIAHARRRILHFNATPYPTSSWIVQQLRETFPEETAAEYVILDRDAKFDRQVTEMLKAMGSRPTRTSYRSPWQNGTAERWIGSCRRELLDHVIVLNEAHLRRLLRDYINSYHEDRTHDGLDKDTPDRRPVEQRCSHRPLVLAMPRVGGLHHRYMWRQAA